MNDTEPAASPKEERLSLHIYQGALAGAARVLSEAIVHPSTLESERVKLIALRAAVEQEAFGE